MNAIAKDNLTDTPISSPQMATSFQEATPAQVRDWLRLGEAVLIDVREPDEFSYEHIAGAILLPLSRFDPLQARAKAKSGQRIVMQCKGGRRSADACRLAAPLAASGVPIFTLAGGIEAWKKANLPVVVNNKVSRISIMRQVQLVIGLSVLIGSALTWFWDPRFISIPAFFGAGLVFAGASGTCALATVIGWMPWNKADTGSASCVTDSRSA